MKIINLNKTYSFETNSGMGFLAGSMNHGQMAIFIPRSSGSGAGVGFADGAGFVPIGDEAIPCFLCDPARLPLIAVNLPLVLPIGDCVAEAYLCLSNEFCLHPLGDSQRPMPLLLKHKNFEKITINNKY